MAVPTSVNDLSVVISSNSPAGNESVGSPGSVDDYFRAHAGIIAQVNAAKADKASPTFTGTVALPTSWSINGTAVTATAEQLNAATADHYVENYGAVGDGTTDDTVAIQAAITAAIAGTGGSNTVVFKAKTYRTTATISVDLSGSKSIRIIGQATKCRKDGSVADSSGTIIKADFTAGFQEALRIWNAATTIGTESARCFFEVADLGIVYVGSATSGYGLVLGTASTQLDGNHNSVVRNVSVSGFYTQQLYAVSTRAVHFDNCSFTCRGSGSTATSVLIENKSSTRFAGDMVFNTCQFTGSGTASQANVFLSADASGAEVRGIHFTDSVFYYGSVGLTLYAGSGGKMEDVFIDSCACDGAGSTDSDVDIAIKLEATGSGSIVTGINISNSYIVNWDVFGVKAEQTTSGVVSSVNVTGNYIGMCEISGIYFDGTEGFVASSNTLFDCGTSGGGHAAIAVTGATAGLFSITGNVHRNTTATRTADYVVAVSEPGAGNIHEFVVTGNVGHAGTSAVSDNTTTSNKTVSGNWRRA